MSAPIFSPVFGPQLHHSRLNPISIWNYFNGNVTFYLLLTFLLVTYVYTEFEMVFHCAGGYTSVFFFLFGNSFPRFPYKMVLPSLQPYFMWKKVLSTKFVSYKIRKMFSVLKIYSAMCLDGVTALVRLCSSSEGFFYSFGVWSVKINFVVKISISRMYVCIR